ncbi:hypothetical protein BH23CHL8_BH23CHL8_05180 [soil metagenome]
MPFRARFDCLWCGRAYATRAPDDIEGWASLCPDCLARAQENGFLRSRLRTALSERARAAPASAGERDAWYLRQPPYSGGPLIDLPWQMELDQATRWLDERPLSGVIVELAAGTGWWSPLLAGKGELWVYEEDPESLELARGRLVAHGLMAHLHPRAPTASAEREADVVFTAFLLGAAQGDADRARRADVVRHWLRPGGTFAFVEAQPREGPGLVAGPSGPLRPATAAAIGRVLAEVGLDAIDVSSTSTAFLMGTATRSAT